MDLLIQPSFGHWPALLAQRSGAALFGRSLQSWRALTRRELGLADDVPIVATGHQTLLWHPGILAKYLAMGAFARAAGAATANLIVDQHAEGFGEFDLPIRLRDGTLAVRRIELCRPRPRKDVPMALHEAFTPPCAPPNLPAALPSVAQGVQMIFDAVYAHRHAPNAALQMARALEDLMRPWVGAPPGVTATNLIGTSLASALLKAMASDPWRCAECYNSAVRDVPEARISPLLVRDDYVELPLWRIRADGRRMHAYDNDVERCVNEREGAMRDRPSDVHDHSAGIDLLPRALFMTALVRLGMCDLFIHGTGGARYDHAMELWIGRWLGVDATPASIAVASATLRLPLLQNTASADAAQARRRARWLWHDPQADNPRARPGPSKRSFLEQIAAQPRNSPRRMQSFLRMHEELSQMRERNPEVRHAQLLAEQASAAEGDAAIAQRRDWAFPLYPREMLDQLNAAIAADLAQELGSSSGRQAEHARESTEA